MSQGGEGAATIRSVPLNINNKIRAPDNNDKICATEYKQEDTRHRMSTIGFVPQSIPNKVRATKRLTLAMNRLINGH